MHEASDEQATRIGETRQQKKMPHFLVACFILDATTPMYCNQEGKSDQLRKVVHYLSVSEVGQNHLNVCV